VSQWLKNVGTSTQPLEDDWRSKRAWLSEFVTSRQRMSLKPGDGIAYYATGLGSVFAVGTVTSFVYEQPEEQHEDYTWRVDVNLSHWRNFVHEGVPLELVSVEERDLRGSIKQKSHITLSPAEYEAISTALAG
jgi:hypothetical protein